MAYDSQISFTLDTICPWTYLAKKRLDRALEQVRLTKQDKVNFTVKYQPYQLYPEASKEGEDKYEWYKKNKYQDDEKKMAMYMTLMSEYGRSADIDFKFGGTVANTLDAHRLIQHYQEDPNDGSAKADGIVNSLYYQYFENERHPSSPETLLKAATDAGVPPSDAKKFIGDEDEGLQEVQMLIREQASLGIDSVPAITIEGKRRDLTLVGAKEVAEYVKALEQIIKEAS